jgi:nucleoside-diphosphate-sugar epimerase
MQVAVIGGTGFIGRYLTRWLVEAGADVGVIHRGRTPVRVPEVRSFQADRKDPFALPAALALASPDVVVDMTAYTRADMEGLVRALPLSVLRLVVISSGDVYRSYGAFRKLGEAKGPAGPSDEGSALRAHLFPYRAQAADPDDLLHDYEKILVEQAARSLAGVPVTVLRLPMVYGPGDPQQRVQGYVQRLGASSRTLTLNAAEAAWRCTRGYVEDVAWGIRLAALDLRAAGGTFNIGEVEALTELGWVQVIAQAIGWRGRLIGDPSAPPSLPAAWDVSLVVDTSRIREVLGFREPVGLEEGLRRTIAARGCG